MKLILITVLTFIAVHQCAASFDTEWKSFKEQFEKSYEPEEDAKRKAIFAQTLKKIENHNSKYEAGIESFEMGINEFADMTNEEFNMQITGQPSELWHTLPMQNMSARASPEQVNWFEYGFKTPVIQQGTCGSCYAMASTAAIEGHYFIKYKQLIQLSQQEIVDCSMDLGNKGCQYGFMHSTFNYLMQNGIGAASSNPYQGIVTQCRKENPRYYIDNWYRTAQNNEEALKEAVAIGPVVVLINAGLDSFKYYNGGLYYDGNCSLNASGVNHFVTVVGYGKNYNGYDYWVIKNSWGLNWGTNGYMYMARNYNQCGIAFQPMYPQVR